MDDGSTASVPPRLSAIASPQHHSLLPYSGLHRSHYGNIQGGVGGN